MKFTIDRNVFLELVSTVAPALEVKSGLPAHKMIQISLLGGSLILNVITPIMSIQTIYPIEQIESTDNCDVCISGSVLLNLLKILPVGPITINYSGEGNLKIKSGRKTSSLNAMDTEAFPLPPMYHNANFLPIKGLLSATNTVKHALGVEETRPVLGCFFIDNGSVSACDGFRLAISPLESPVGNLKLPGVPFKRVSKFLNDEDMFIGLMDSNPNAVYLSSKNKLGVTYVEFRIPVSDYPRLSAIIPKSPYDLVVIKRDELLKAIELVKLTVEKNVPKVVFKIGLDSLSLKTESMAVGWTEENIDITSPVERTLAFNLNFLYDAIKASSDDVRVQVRKETEVVIIESKELFQGIMPLRL